MLEFQVKNLWLLSIRGSPKTGLLAPPELILWESQRFHIGEPVLETPSRPGSYGISHNRVSNQSPIETMRARKNETFLANKV